MIRKIAMEDGYHIISIFMGSFWWDFLKKVMIKKGLICPNLLRPEELEKASSAAIIKNELHDAYEVLFLRVPSSLMGFDDDFEKVIEESMAVSASRQHSGFIVTEDRLFQIVIDFYKYYERKTESYGREYAKKRSRVFGIQWLEDMKRHPEYHKIEWNIWNQTVLDVLKNGSKSSGFF